MDISTLARELNAKSLGSHQIGELQRAQESKHALLQEAALGEGKPVASIFS